MRLKCTILFSALLACALAASEAWADVKIDEANFPDATFRQWLKTKVANGGDVLTDAQIAATEELEPVAEEISQPAGTGTLHGAEKAEMRRQFAASTGHFEK